MWRRGKDRRISKRKWWRKEINRTLTTNGKDKGRLKKKGNQASEKNFKKMRNARKKTGRVEWKPITLLIHGERWVQLLLSSIQICQVWKAVNVHVTWQPVMTPPASYMSCHEASIWLTSNPSLFNASFQQFQHAEQSTIKLWKFKKVLTKLVLDVSNKSTCLS